MMYETIPDMKPYHTNNATYDIANNHWVIKEDERTVGYIYRCDVAGKHVLQFTSTNVNVYTVGEAIEALKKIQWRHDK